MDWKYWPECFHALLAMIYNVILVLAVSFTVLEIYKLSDSLLSLLGFAALLMVMKPGFKRD